MEYKLPEIPLFDVPEELKAYGVGACFMIVREEPGNPNSPLKFLHAYNAATEENVSTQGQGLMTALDRPYEPYTKEDWIRGIELLDMSFVKRINHKD